MRLLVSDAFDKLQHQPPLLIEVEGEAWHRADIMGERRDAQYQTPPALHHRTDQSPRGGGDSPYRH
jgi:hypothetical protein